MEQYSRLATPRFRRITIRVSGIEIELRARPQASRQQLSPEERAYRRSRAEQAIDKARYSALVRWALLI